jgi:hypothetical protein
MATAPQIKLRDGSGYTQNLVFTTNQDSVFIEGRVDVSAVDIQVSINGAPFVSDPGLVQFNLPDFTIPSPASYPEGLVLEPGENTVLIRTIDIIGSVSATASALITKLRLEDVPQVIIPTGIRMRRRRDAVDLLAAIPEALEAGAFGAPAPNNFRGFKFYASVTAGGTSGYYLLNESLVTSASGIYEEDVSEIGSDNTVWESSDGAEFIRLKVSEEDEFGNEIATRINRTYDIVPYSGNLRFLSTLEERRLTQFARFRHFRAGAAGTLNEDQFATIPSVDPLYYVVSAVYFDPTSGAEIESPYSQEVLGSPLVIDTAIRDLPGRTQFQVVTDYVTAIQRVNQDISLIPGSTTRDVSIDPFSSEADRLYFLLDFIHRAQSFLTLLQVDDANGDGLSDPVDSSAYKTALKAALGFSTNAAVQNLIDSAFDKLAGNVTKSRLPGRPAVGQATFYTTSRPAFDLPIPSGTIVTTQADSALGIPSVRFRVGGTYVMLAANADAYFNFDKKRYEIVVDLVAETIGEDGNRPADQIRSAQGVSGLLVTNEEATIYGLNRESNADLAARAMLSFVSVDTGTPGGYAATSAAQIGVIKSKVVKSGDELMMRDYDDVRHKHIGGKVDVWVQGLRERQITENFAFTFEVARDIQCQIIDLATLTLRVQDSRVTVNTPITEILDNLGQGLGVRNVTQGLDYILTNAVIVDYQTFRLDPAIVGQPVTGIDDVITADYRFRVLNQFQFTFQPVRRVVSVVGEVSGTLTPTSGYNLFKTDDPLLEGESTISHDFLSITQQGGIPSGDTLTVNAEEHVLIGFIEEPLLSIGINTKTIRVFNQARTLEFDGPDAVTPDYEILEGTPTSPPRIVRTANSDIVNGSTVSVDYVHDENFTVTYVINDLLQQLQRVIESKRHITADVLVKQAIENEVEIETTVQLLSGATKDKVDPAVRSAVSLELNKRTIGQGVAQSDVINAIDSTSGVDSQIVPFARMAYADGSRKLRETLSSTALEMSSLGIGGNIAYLLTTPLQSPTTDGGGLNTEHKGVFQDDEPMTLSATLSAVASSANQAFIIGAQGAVIAGYTDLATLLAAGFLTAEAQQAELLKRTANHVVIALDSAKDPLDHAYAVSYVVRGDSGSKDLTSTGVEYVSLGSFTVTYRSANA